MDVATSVTNPSRPRLDRLHGLVFCVVLYLVGLALNFSLMSAANSQRWLTGEEASVSFKDVVFLGLRLQHCRYDTNLGGHLFYGLAYWAHPHPGLFHGREFKAVMMAFAGPLAYMLSRRLGLGSIAGFFTGLFLILLPGCSAFSWVAIEAGLDLLLGGIALYFALGRPGWRWLAASGFLGLGMLVYGGTAAFIPPVLALVGLASWRDRKMIGWAVGFLLLLIAILAIPSLWWAGRSEAFRGGGSVDLAGAPFLFLRMNYECWYKARSYYFFSTSPALGGFLVLPALLAGAFFTLRNARTWWPVWLLAVCSTALYCVAATPTGVRRSLGLCLASSLFLGALIESADRLHRLPVLARQAIGPILVVILGFQTLRTGSDLRAGRLPLPRDVEWIAPDMSLLMGQGTFAPDAKQRILDLENPIRAVCMPFMLRGRFLPESAPSFTLEEIRELYETRDPERFK